MDEATEIWFMILLLSQDNSHWHPLTCLVLRVEKNAQDIRLNECISHMGYARVQFVPCPSWRQHLKETVLFKKVITVGFGIDLQALSDWRCNIWWQYGTLFPLVRLLGPQVLQQVVILQIAGCIGEANPEALSGRTCKCLSQKLNLQIC
jgi:hypothetical protein